MIFDESDPKYRLSCCCGAHVQTASTGYVCLTLLIALIATVQGAIRYATTNTYHEQFVALILLTVSLLTIGSIFVWSWAVRRGRWSLMMLLHGALATWATICLGGAVLSAYALTTESDEFMRKVIRMTFATDEHWSTSATPTIVCWAAVVFFVFLTAFFASAVFVLFMYYGYLVAREESKKIPSWKLGRTSISLHPIAQMPDDNVKDVPFVFTSMPQY